MLASTGVAGRPIFHADFGRYLIGLREAHGWSQSDAARYGHKQNPLLTRQVLLHLEAGKTKDPDPEVLKALAALYGVPYVDVAGRFVALRYGIVIGDRDLTIHSTASTASRSRKKQENTTGSAGVQLARLLSIQDLKDSNVLDDPEVDLLEAYRTLSKRGKEYLAGVAADLRRIEVERAISTHRARKSAQILKLTQRKEGGSP